LLGVSLSPCCRSHPARVVRRVSQAATAHAAFTFPVAGSASGAAHFRGPLCVRFRYSLDTRPHPADGVVERLQEVGFPSPCSPSYRALAFPLVGFPPTEHASLSWTHNRTCHFDGIRLSTCDPSPWSPMKRRFPFRQFHRCPPVDSLRVHWVPLVPSSHRLGAFAVSPHPGVHGFPVRRLLCPIRLFVRALAFRWGLPYLLPTRLDIPHEVSRVQYGRLERNAVGGVFLSLPRPRFAAPQSLDRG
jgi:hypothetical protein